MRQLPNLLAPLALAACATTAPPPEAPPLNAAGGTCNAASVQSHIGHTAQTAAGPVLLRESGARSLRWIGPGMAVTMDYSETRLNAVYDDAMLITELRCG